MPKRHLTEKVLGRRGFLQACGALGVGALAAGCGAGGAGSSSKELTFWLTPNASDAEMAAYVKRMATGFEKQGGGAKVTDLIVPWENALTKYTAAYTGGNPPDVAYQIIPWMGKWRTSGVLADFKKHLGSDVNPLTKGVPQGYLDAASGNKGELFGIPFVQAYYVLCINEDIWEKAGKPALPATYDEMIPFAKALTMDTSGRKLGESGFNSSHVAHYGMTWPLVPTVQTNYVWNYLWSYDSDYISADHKDIGFNNDQGRAALQNLKAMSDSGAATPKGFYTDPTQWDNAIFAGKTGMQWVGQFTADRATQYPKARIKVIELPSGPTGIKSMVAGCGYWTVSARSKSLGQAFELARFLLEPNQADDYVHTIVGQPARAVAGKFYSKPLQDPRMNTFLNEATPENKYARPTLVLPYEPEDYLLGKINDYLSGRQSLDQMIKEASNQVKQMARNAR
jgi:multiple sugar transport system substrate-binding protein